MFSYVSLEARVPRQLSDEHSSVGDTLIEAWASMKSFVSRDDDSNDSGGGTGGRNPNVNFRGERTKDTHASTTDANRWNGPPKPNPGAASECSIRCG